MADGSEIPKKYRNLKPPWQKGVKHSHKPTGRPNRRALIESLQKTYELNPSPVNMNRFIRQMEKKCPQEIAHYLAGKPVERIDLSGELKHTVDPSIVAAAQVAIGKL